MNEEAAKAAIAEMQKQIQDLTADQMDESDWLCHSGVLITGNEAKALIELWNFYQMYKPR